jgi:hypothetical protein
MKKILLAVAMIVTATSGASANSVDSATLYKAHIQFYERMTNHATPWRSSYLPRVGQTKGDDYRNCVDKGYWKSTDTSAYKNYDAHTFCAWHAEIGPFK